MLFSRAVSLHLVTVFFSLVNCIYGATVTYDLVFSRRFASPDGVERSSIVVNGELIGPSIEAFVGDSVVINVTNLGIFCSNYETPLLALLTV